MPKNPKVNPMLGTWRNVTGTWSERNEMDGPARMGPNDSCLASPPPMARACVFSPTHLTPLSCGQQMWKIELAPSSRRLFPNANHMRFFWMGIRYAPTPSPATNLTRLGCQIFAKQHFSCFSVTVARNVTERIHILNNLPKDMEEREGTGPERDRTYKKNITFYRTCGGTWRNWTGTWQNV